MERNFAALVVGVSIFTFAAIVNVTNMQRESSEPVPSKLTAPAATKVQTPKPPSLKTGEIGDQANTMAE